MKYCLRYIRKDWKIFNEVEEISINLNNIKNLKLDLEEFCQIHKTQRINLIIPNYEVITNKGYIPYIFDFQEKHREYNIYIRLPMIDKEFYPALKEKYPKMKFFLNTFVKDWDSLQGLIAEGVSDIYVVDELCFSIKEVAAIAHKNNVQVRVFPNVAQSSWKKTSAYKKFWIRPEDTTYYEDFVDVFEFDGKDEQQNTLYQIYNVDKQWAGDLNNLILGLNTEINSMGILPRFAEKRIECQHKCQKGINCQMCEAIISLSQTLGKNEIRIKLDIEKGKDGNNG